MYWSPELAAYLDLAPWPATKYELLDFCTRQTIPIEVINNLEELADDDYIYLNIGEIWRDNPFSDEIFFGGGDDL